MGATEGMSETEGPPSPWLLRWGPWLVGVALVAGALFWLLPRENRTVEAPEVATDTVQMLEALGYSEWTDGREVDLSASGVRRFDPERTAPGYNLFTHRKHSEAVLTGLDGRRLHEWKHPDWNEGNWQHAELQPDGSLFVVMKKDALVKFDWDSDVLWKTDRDAHHDLDLDPEGSVYVLAMEIRDFPFEDGTIPVRDNQIVVFSPEGKFLREISLFPLLEEFVPRASLQMIQKIGSDRAHYQGPDKELIDLLHTNSIEILREDLGTVAPAGSLLLSVRNLDLLVIIDAAGEEILWSWGPGEVIRQHHATVLPNGNILFFDNRKGESGSRVLELDPATKEVMWEYRGTEEEPFYSYSRGGSQKLDNENVLITESNQGRVFEITPSGDIVWEYLNPVLKPSTKRRGTFYRMRRIPPGYLGPQFESRLHADESEE